MPLGHLELCPRNGHERAVSRFYPSIKSFPIRRRQEQPTTLPPLSNILYKARLATYGTGRTKWWPHDKNKNHGATSKNVRLIYIVIISAGHHLDGARGFYL